MVSGSLKLLLLASTYSAVALAAPSDRDAPSRVAARAVCMPASLDNSQLDDTPAIHAAIASCGNGGTIVIPAGKTYSLRTMLDFTGCTNCDFQIRSLTGSGVIDGNGQRAYDIFAVDESLARPTALYIIGGSSITVTGFTIKNPPNVFIGQKGAAVNINYASLTMTAASKSTNAPKNTDGFDIGESTYTTIKNIYVSNQDDCVAFKSGCNYVTVDTITCAGTNYGLVVGSLGKDNADFVKNVYVNKATMINCGKAAGIKVYTGGPDHGTSTVSNVTWNDVTVDGCDFGAQIQSCYGASGAACNTNPSAASLTDIYFTNFKGKTNAKQTPNVANLNCPAAGTCNLYFTNWDVTPPSGSPVNQCANIDNNPGITCSPGASG